MSLKSYSAYLAVVFLTLKCMNQYPKLIHEVSDQLQI